MFAGLLLRIWFLRHPMIPDDDSDVYADLASNLFHHGIYGVTDGPEIDPTLIRLPGYPLFLGVMFLLFGSGNLQPVFLVQIGFDLLGCWLIASFVREQASERAGTVAMFLAALCPFTAAYSTIALTECLTVFSICLAMWSVGRLLQAQGEGLVDRGAVIYAAIAMALAMLLRPDGVLLAIAVTTAILWYAWRQGRPLRGIRTALICVVLAVLPLAPWAIRNWRTFQVIQPLAPRRVNDPGEYVTYGFYRWMNTWSVDIVSTGNVFWKLGTASIDINDLPLRAFDSPAQRAETATLLAEYNVRHSLGPALDAKFGALAEERLRAHPLRYRVEVPALRVADMILRPRTETMALRADWWLFRATGLKVEETILLGLLNVTFVAAALMGLARRRVPWIVLGVVYIVLRCGLLATMENSEPRYTLEILPICIAFSACGFAAKRIPRLQVSMPANEGSGAEVPA
jgi:hypothetical protein